jgi:hypothetical protein
MRKLIIVGLLTFSSLMASPIVMADPGSVSAVFTCPTISGSDMQTLRNWGYRITGYGTEVIDGNPDMYAPFFNYYVPSGANLPANLAEGSYTSSSTSYESTTGIVGCNYTSSGGYDAFGVVYQTTHGDGGIITAQTANTITVAFTVGAKKPA